MEEIGLEILIVFILILINGFFAMSEVAVFASRRARLQHKSNEGDKRASAALKLAENPNRLLPTVQVGITLIGVLAGAVGGATIADALAAELAKIPGLEAYSEEIALTAIVVLITYFSILLGELVPKRLALQQPERIASGISGAMRFIALIFSPVVWFLGKSTDFVLRLLGVKQMAELPVTEEELLVQLEQGRKAGVFQESEQDMVEGVFSLSDQRVNALMTPRNEITWLDVNDTVDEIRRKVKESPFSRFPVGMDSLDHLVGVVRAKELLLADLEHGEQLREISRPPLYIPEMAFGSRALEMFRESQRELMFVVDEFGTVQGIITLADILEEIVGEFEDEPQATQREDGSWLLDGMLPNEEFKELFQLRRLPDEEEYETLGGFILLHMGRIPQTADHFEWGNLVFEIVDMDGNRVDKVLVTAKPATTPAAKE